MKVIGLCGGTGSGKSSACRFFEEYGIKCIDADKVYHDLISTDSECTNELIDYFGHTISSSPGIDRKRLRDIAFSSDDALWNLNRITHKHILSQIRLKIEELKGTNCLGVVVDAPLLFESGFDKECDLTLCIVANEQKRIERIVLRDGISCEAARLRINAQLSNEELINRCTFSIENNSTERDLENKVYSLIKVIFKN
jgi:dephospho-CoA kinase